MASYEIIVIGAGHNGLICGAYLARAGLRVLVVEKRLELGGGLCTEEVVLPGFYHNLHSFFHRWVPELPFYVDLELDKYGVRYILPPVQSVSPLSDGRCLIWHVDVDKTCKNISYFSPKDAKTYLELKARYQKMSSEILVPETYSPPLPCDEKAALLEKTDLGREYLGISARTPRQLAMETFESEPMRAMMLFLVTVRGFMVDEPGLGYCFASLLIGGTKGSLCAGGSHNLAHGIAKALIAAGGDIWEQCGAREIVVEGGEARGIILEDGRRVLAEKAVVSAVDPTQTFLEMVGDSHLPADFLEKARNFKYGPLNILFGAYAALREAPHYTSASFDPDIDRALNYNIGYECVGDFDDHMHEITQGIPPRVPGLQCAVPTLHDPTQAPLGRHTVLAWQFVPYELKDGGVKKWDEIAEGYMETCLERWRHYAPNLADENILAKWPFTPLDIERKLVNMKRGDAGLGAYFRIQMLENRPLPGAKPYCTPLPRLYICSSAAHPGGAITGAPGYNAAGVILDDMNLKRWWTTRDARVLWERAR